MPTLLKKITFVAKRLKATYIVVFLLLLQIVIIDFRSKRVHSKVCALEQRIIDYIRCAAIFGRSAGYPFFNR
jgi:hypothetical protein